MHEMAFFEPKIPEIDFTKNLGDRKFVKFSHCVKARIAQTQSGNNENNLSRIFGKNFVKVTVYFR